ncbi:MAG: VWA domain-containing protein, partial [Planctomycetes bacterium]|nr:VWA domain-containing protein [Planctomycetota bacterium]
MTMVNRLKAFTAILGAAALITSAFVRGDAPGGKTTGTGGGFNPIGVKLNDDLITNRFSKQPVLTYETQSGEAYFALQLKLTLKAAPARPRDLVLIVDTSASQVGKYLDASRLIVDRIIQDASPRDRISLWVINTPKATRPLSGGLRDADNKDQISSMAKALDTEYASGAVDLANGIDKALLDFDGKISRQQAIVFIGDAESAYAQLNEKERFQLASKVREAKVQFFAIPVGTAINGLNMHALATGTGGSVVRFSQEIKDAKKAVISLVAKLNEAMLVPVINPTKFDFGPTVAEFFPTRLPPLRGDTPTLLVGKFVKGKMPAKLEGTIDGKVGTVETKVTVDEVVPPAGVENFFLTAIVRQWSESTMKEMPAMLRSDRTLALAFEQGRLSRDEYLTQAQWALGANQFETAKNLSNAAQKLDPNDAEVKALAKVVAKIDKGELTLEKLRAATGQRIGVKFEKDENGQMRQVRVNLEEIAWQDPAVQNPNPNNNAPVGDPNALLKAEQARKSILEQQVNLTVQETLARARDLMRSGDPKSAKDLILAQRDSIRSNPDVGEALRNQLIGRMETLMMDIGMRGEVILRS